MKDFQINNHGSIIILVPQSQAAEKWVEDKIGSGNGYQPYWPSVIIEPRYIDDIIEGIQLDGLVVE